jgi:hypothetical protein
LLKSNFIIQLFAPHTASNFDDDDFDNDNNNNNDDDDDDKNSEDALDEMLFSLTVLKKKDLCSQVGQTPVRVSEILHTYVHILNFPHPQELHWLQHRNNKT